MGGAERCDQRLTANPTERKRTKIWYKKTLHHLMNICTFSALVLYQKLGGKMDVWQFGDDLIERIIVKSFRTGRGTSETWQKVKRRGSTTCGTETLTSVLYVPATHEKQRKKEVCSVCCKKSKKIIQTSVCRV
jgi:hypothetical protein